ncbi:MAG: FtsX-like permease family protein [Pseudomonadota bacterium]|nr:FtsX-like permease family protein [Pseudomonadota bacterium]
MKTIRLAFRMLARDWRAGELNVLLAALVLAVMSIGTVGLFADRVKGALTREANLLLGADVLISADRPLPDEYAQEALARGLVVSPAVKFLSMVQRLDAARGAQGDSSVVQPRTLLADVKAVRAPYPLRGQIDISDGQTTGTVRPGTVPSSGEVWPDTRLASRLGLGVGDRLTLGDMTFRVGAIVQQEPEIASGMLAIGPRLLMNMEDVPATHLLQPGNRAVYRLYVAQRSSADALAKYIDWTTVRLAAGQRMENIRDLRPEVRQTLERAEKFLGLSSLVAVTLAAVAVALGASRYLRRHLDTAAILRCLGASRRRVLLMFVLQFATFGAVAGVIGLALAGVGQQLLVLLLASLSATELPWPSITPALGAFAAGLALLFGFALPPLLALAGAPPVRVLRRDLPRPRVGGVLAYVLGAVTIAGLIAWQAQDAKTAVIMIAAMAGLVGATAVSAWMVIVLLRRLPQRGVTWRFGLANLRRRPLASSLQVGALSLGIMALLLLTAVRGDLIRNWKASLPPDAPNHFMINILPEQVSGVRGALEAATHSAVTLYPMVRGRLVAINDQPLDMAKYQEQRARRLAEREFNLSWVAELPTGNHIVGGEWWNDAQARNGLSMEQGIAQTLGLKLGDNLTWDIAGSRISARVTSLRKVDWDTFRPNFFTLFPPGVLDAMPQTYIGAARLPESALSAGWLTGLLQRFPNVLAIDVGEVIRQVQTIMDQVARAVEFVFMFTLIGGLLVLQAAIAATQDERQRDAAVLRTLGASTAQLTSAQLAEFGLLGALSGLLAAAGATITGYVLADRVFQIPYTANVNLWLIGVLGGTACVTLAGWLGTRRTLRVPPLMVLRQLG